jgi:hypothetical protein
MSQGTRVTCEDLETGETVTETIVNGYLVICDGDHYVSSQSHHRDFCGVGEAKCIIVKRRRSTP